MTPASADAWAQLRTGGHFQWAVIGELAFVVYAYAQTIRRRQPERAMLGLAFWCAELVWEMLNALLLPATGRAALWTVGGSSSLVIYVGLNVEISLLFAVMPLVLFDLLPDDRDARMWGVRSRLAVPVALGCLCVAVECGLNRLGALIWEYWFWRWPNVVLIAIAYSAPLVALAEIHDRASLRTKVRLSAGCAALAIAAHLTFATWLQLI